MPWTFAHPAAVLPFVGLTGPKRLSLAALVIGSMSPDFGYYLGLYDLAGIAHTPPGILALCLPSGLLVVWLSRGLQRPVAYLLPQPHGQALLAAGGAATPRNVLSVSLLAVALALGAATHIIWDAFTHEGRFFVAHIAALQTPVFRAFNREFRVFNLLQHASTFGGCACLALAYYRHASRFGPMRPVNAEDWRRCRRLAGIALAAMVAAAPFALYDALAAEARLFTSVLLVREVIYSTSAFLLLLSLAALWCQRRVPR